MAPRPHTRFTFHQAQHSTMLSSWSAYVYVGQYPSGDLAVWSEVEDAHGKETRQYIGKIRTAETLISALGSCCYMVEFDDAQSALRDQLWSLRSLVPAIADDVERLFREEDAELEQDAIA